MSKLAKIKWLTTLGAILILFWILIFFSPEKENSNTQVIDNKIETTGTVNTDNPLPIIKEENKIVLEQSIDRGAPIALVIDNFSESWPNTGLNQAVVVYEAPVEADITRLLAIFNQNYLPDKIGPIRSARSYFAEWAEEYGALFIHAGGSTDFLEKQKNKEYSLFDLDEIGADGVYFWRNSLRNKPHNLYISRDSIQQLVESKKELKKMRGDYYSWSFDKNAIFSERASLIVKINYREPVIWQFDKNKNAYLRFQNNQSFVDDEGEQMATENLIIQKTEIKILDKIGHRFVKTVGEGEALIFQGGNLIQGKWVRENKNQRTKFYTPLGEEIKFLPGKIWIEIVSNHEILY